MGAVLYYSETDAKRKDESCVIPDDEKFKAYLKEEEACYKYDQGIISIIGKRQSSVCYEEFDKNDKDIDITIYIWPNL